MKNLARRFLCGAALVAAVVPAAAAERAAGHLRMRTITAHPVNPGNPASSAIADHVLPFGDGFGAGTWRLPDSGPGGATAQLFDDSGRLRYVSQR